MKNQFSRTIGIVTMLVLFVMLTGGCLQKPDEEEKPTEMETSENGNTPQPQPTPEPEVTSGGLYTNKEYGFTLAYPKEWAGVRMREELGTNPNDPLEKVLYFEVKVTPDNVFDRSGLFYIGVDKNPEFLSLLDWLKANKQVITYGDGGDPMDFGFKEEKISDSIIGIRVYAIGEITQPYATGPYFFKKDKIFSLYGMQDELPWENYYQIVNGIIKSLKFSQ